MTYSPFAGDALQEIEKRVDKAKQKSAILIEQSQQMFNGTIRLIEQSKKLLVERRTQNRLGMGP